MDTAYEKTTKPTGWVLRKVDGKWMITEYYVMLGPSSVPHRTELIRDDQWEAIACLAHRVNNAEGK